MVAQLLNYYLFAITWIAHHQYKKLSNSLFRDFILYKKQIQRWETLTIKNNHAFKCHFIKEQTWNVVNK